MAYNDKKLKTDLEGKPIPQAYNPAIDDYEPVHSTNNALHQVIYGPNGQPISTVGNKLAVRATELEALMQGLATEGKLEQVRQLLAGVATEAKLEQARTLLDAISTKDFATSSKQDALKIAVEDLKSELNLVKSELANIKANQLSGDQKVQLSGTLTELEQVRELLDAISGKDFATQTTLAAVLAKLADLESELATIKANQLSGDQKVQLSGNITLQYKYSIIPNTGARHSFGVSGAKLLHNGPMTFWLKNNFDLGTRNNVQLHWYTGGNQIIPPTILPNIPAGATLGVVVGGYPIRAEDTSELIWVPNPGAHLVRISWDIRSDATGVGMEALCTYYSPEEVT